LSTACELTMFISSTSVTFSVTCIFNYEIMPGTLANTFVFKLFLLQGNAQAHLTYGGRFHGTLGRS